MGHAQNAITDEHRAACLNIAAAWAELADGMERRSRCEAGTAAMRVA